MSNDLFELAAPVDEQGTVEAGPAHLQPPAPVSPLTLHWLTARAEFVSASNEAKPHWDISRELLALGAVRSVYWMALGQGETALAREIGDWWEECQPLHGLGRVIQ